MDFPRRYNAARDFIDRHVDGGLADKPAFIDARRALTYGELASTTRQMANVLAGLDVQPEARIALIMHDTADWPIAFWGALRAGVVPVAINTLLSTAQYEYMLADSRAQAVFVSRPLLSVIEPCLEKLPHLRHVIVSGVPAADRPSFGELVSQASADFETADTCADEVAFWLYSSGSTGNPKGVRHVHTSLMVTADTYGRQVLGIRPGDVVLSAAKLFFAYGLGNSMTFPMSVGATAILLADRPTPAGVFALLRQHAASVFFGVPTLYAAMLADPQCTPEAGSSELRLCVSAGEALPAEVGRSWQRRFGVDILDGVGSTEMLHIYLSNHPGDIRYGTCGKPVPGYGVRLVDESGHEVGVDEIGEMMVEGESAADGYWHQRAKSRATFEGRSTRTGDKFVRDADGYYRICGRTDDMFKVSGIWVSPFEVEAALIGHPAVLEAAVVPKADADELLKPKAFVVLKPGHSPEKLTPELKEHVKASIGRWKYPRWIEFVETLPKTATGKIQRFKLRD
ncbi:MAG TPA: benzoate-CoA ligase family protein [Aestuariivirgaceae bacterium]|nr:benzoate-CoA ligase family protein [Aestuariivirgaceae bacterium]